jgi:hypothetical protein
MFPNIPEDCLDLMKNLLCMDPRKRLSAEEALAHKFFNEDINCAEELKNCLNN